MSLVARHLEANGIPTLVIGCAKDIVESCAVARLLFTDFPLGNPCGRPHDAEMQRAILEMGFELLESARMGRTTVQTPYRWSEDETWKELVLTKERPFLEGEHYDKWMKGKELYRKLKAEGRV